MTREEEIFNTALEEYFPYNQESENRDAFMLGAKWADKIMLDKACEFLKSYRQDTPDGTGYIAGIINDKTIEDFRNYIKGG